MTSRRSPTGLASRLLGALQDQIETWGDQLPDAASLTEEVHRYWDEIESASVVKPLLDHALAGKVRDALLAALLEWDSFSFDDQSWLASAVVYFIESDDDEHDFDSPVGFDDDAEVTNAVLVMIGRPDLVIP